MNDDTLPHPAAADFDRLDSLPTGDPKLVEAAEKTAKWLDQRGAKGAARKLHERIGRLREAERAELVHNLLGEVSTSPSPGLLHCRLELIETAQELLDAEHENDSASLNDCERAIVQALQESGPLRGQALAQKAGYPFNSHFKATAASLVKRRTIKNTQPVGYHLPSQD